MTTEGPLRETSMADEPMADKPIKVVPLYFGEAPVGQSELPELEVEDARRRTPLIGIAAAVAAGATVALLVVAIVLATAGDYALATGLGYVSIGLSVMAVIVGLLAAIGDRGRRTGVAAVVVGILANPLVLLVVLRFFGNLITA